MDPRQAHTPRQPEFRRITRTYDEATDWTVSNPRLEALADVIVQYAQKRVTADLDDPAAVLGSLLHARTTPALDRLHELDEERRL